MLTVGRTLQNKQLLFKGKHVLFFTSMHNIVNTFHEYVCSQSNSCLKWCDKKPDILPQAVSAVMSIPSLQTTCWTWHWDWTASANHILPCSISKLICSTKKAGQQIPKRKTSCLFASMSQYRSPWIFLFCFRRWLNSQFIPLTPKPLEKTHIDIVCLSYNTQTLLPKRCDWRCVI